MQLEQRVGEAIRDSGLLRSGDTVVVGVSGGADSVALLLCLSRLPGLELRLVVAHLNHGLRGDESDGDEAFVAALAASLGITYEADRFDVAGLAQRERLSLEDAGRRARYRFFDQTADRYGAAAVALAHHADDQAETVLMRLLRGSGGRGLAAMAPVSRGRYLRPFLDVTRAEIEAYLARHGRDYRHDRSNDDPGFLRNRIRHELLPLLRSYNPDIAAGLAGTAAILAADEDLLDRVTEEAFGRHGREGEGGVELSLTGLRGELPALRLRLYRRALRCIAPLLPRIARRHLLAVDRLVMAAAPNGRLDLPGCRVVRAYDRLLFSGERPEPSPPYLLEIPGPGLYPLPVGGALRVTPAAAGTAPPGERPDLVLIDGAAAPFPWLVRGFRPGDRLQPAGMAGTRKVKELFMERHIPREERGRVPLLFAGDRLLWVCGQRRSAHALCDGPAALAVAVEFVGAVP